MYKMNMNEVNHQYICLIINNNIDKDKNIIDY